MIPCIDVIQVQESMPIGKWVSVKQIMRNVYVDCIDEELGKRQKIYNKLMKLRKSKDVERRYPNTQSVEYKRLR